MSSITHIVLFEFKADTRSQKILDVCDHMLSLQEMCLSSTTDKPYIKSIKGGTNNSPEGVEAGTTHAFVVEFGNVDDRDYYVLKDPAHMAFKKAASEFLTKAIVVDFTPGIFTP